MVVVLTQQAGGRVYRPASAIQGGVEKSRLRWLFTSGGSVGELEILDVQAIGDLLYLVAGEVGFERLNVKDPRNP